VAAATVNATGSSEPEQADWLRKALIELEIIPCIPGRKAPKLPVEYDAEIYKERRRIENMFGRLKDWRRIATCDDSCPILFLSACALAATVIYWS
jgi:transposase